MTNRDSNQSVTPWSLTNWEFMSGVCDTLEADQLGVYFGSLWHIVAWPTGSLSREYRTLGDWQTCVFLESMTLGAWTGGSSFEGVYDTLEPDKLRVYSGRLWHIRAWQTGSLFRESMTTLSHPQRVCGESMTPYLTNWEFMLGVYNTLELYQKRV